MFEADPEPFVVRLKLTPLVPAKPLVRDELHTSVRASD